MLRKTTSIVMLALIAYINGCSAFRSSTEQVNVRCMPEGSTIMINDARFQTTASYQAQRNAPLLVRCYKQGYAPYSQTISTHLNTTGILDIVGTFFFLFPIVGLLTPGAFSLDVTDINVQLFQESK